MMNNKQKYSEQPMPQAGYAILTGAYLVILGIFFRYTSTEEIALLQDITWWRFLIIATACYKLAWLLSRDFVTSFLRAPFTHYEQSLGSGSVTESAKGEGLKRAVGELITCPWCMTQWTAAFFLYAYTFWPDMTIFFAYIMVFVTIGEVMHWVYEQMLLYKNENR